MAGTVRILVLTITILAALGTAGACDDSSDCYGGEKCCEDSTSILTNKYCCASSIAYSCYSIASGDFYCDATCCGNYGYQTCCDSTDLNNVLTAVSSSVAISIGAIIGIVVGCIVFIIVVVVIICVCCCAAASRSPSTGVVVTPVQQPTIAMVHTTTSTSHQAQQLQQYPGNYAQPPPAYPGTIGQPQKY